MSKIFNMLDLKFYKENYLILVALILSILFIKIFNLSQIPENSFLENIQLFALLAGFFSCFKTRKYKTFFIFLGLILLLMSAREISYGRVLVENTDIVFNKTIAHIIVGLYIGASVLFALIKKIWVDIIDIIKTIKFPLWTFLISFGCVFVQILSEELIHNTCIEETAEFMLYASIVSLILIYRNK